MGAPINSFEIIESIRFFAQLASTEGVSQKVKDRCNEFMERLMDSLEQSINETTATAAGLKLV